MPAAECEAKEGVMKMWLGSHQKAQLLQHPVIGCLLGVVEWVCVVHSRYRCHDAGTRFMHGQDFRHDIGLVNPMFAAAPSASSQSSSNIRKLPL